LFLFRARISTIQCSSFSPPPVPLTLDPPSSLYFFGLSEQRFEPLLFSSFRPPPSRIEVPIISASLAPAPHFFFPSSFQIAFFAGTTHSLFFSSTFMTPRFAALWPLRHSLIIEKAVVADLPSTPSFLRWQVEPPNISSFLLFFFIENSVALD